ncbi:EAP30/Vps36 family-domain-containing protein [Naematelia encephala]|uniref:Vacuolar protein-sorting-associated protein 36 n=1 Tax=Naematelia encephala TaxID=71784 RepID=A0A1Y2BHQ6_9TREE|nr:EAP30/Vps36 family-domain-containing protein [Naematelia encephala]
MRSSPKITLSIGKPPTLVEADSEVSASWTCGVCGYVNALSPTEGVPSPAAKCGLCGVGFSTSRSSSSLPTTRSGTPQPIPAIPAINEDPDGGIACPACTFLNHASLSHCEICSTPLPSNRKRTVASVASTSAVQQNGGDVALEVVRLSFRNGGVKEAYRRLKNVLGSKSWERQVNPSNTSADSTDGAMSTPRAGAGIGVDGILQSMSLDAKSQDDDMQTAFKDLEVLMVRAGEMVRMAQSLNAKLTAQQQSSNTPSDEETTLIRTSLVQLGLPAPALTQDMVKDDRRYFDGLAKELGGLLTGRPGDRETQGLMVGRQGRGVIGLDEVWGLWMRARGVSLLPPSTLISILPFLPQHTSPQIRPLTLPSSLMVLYSPYYAPLNLLSRILALLTPSPTSIQEPSLSVIDISAHEGLPIGLAKEFIEQLETTRVHVLPGSQEASGLVRDDQAAQADGGVRWYRDIISGWPV